MASGAAKRYTQAVFSLAREKESFSQWQTDLERLEAAVQDPQAAQYLESPNISTAAKQQFLDSVLANNSAEVRNLARLLLQRGRLNIVPDMVQQFEASVLEQQGIAVAEVTTAEPLDAEAQEAVRQQLTKLVGRDIQLKMKTDPAIIGGIVARIGDQLIDGSVINQLRRLRTRLATAS